MIAKKPSIATLRNRTATQNSQPHAETLDANQLVEDQGLTGLQSTETLFEPTAPTTIRQSGLPEALVESLVFKVLMATGHATGRGLAGELGLPAKPIIEMLAGFKSRQLVQHKDSTARSLVSVLPCR